MNKRFTGFKVLAVFLCMIILSSCSNNSAQQSNNASQIAADTVSNANNGDVKNANIVTSDMVTYENDDYYSEWKNQNPNYIELNGTSARLTGTGAVVNGSKTTITTAGVYAVSGKLDNGQIIVDVQDKGTVKLILNGMEINCADNAPIYVKNAGKTIITLQEGTQNFVTDGEKYVFPDSSTDEPSAAIFSKDNLTVNGTGELTVRANFKDGIASKDDLKITGGNINIYSADDGLIGRDMVMVKGGNITIEAGGDGIKATNDTDTVKGFIALEGGTFDINAGADGIQASIDITISGGTLKIDSSDDAIHSNNSITIAGGDISIASGDDGIHADSSVAIKGGKTNITKSYEGVESANISVSGGETHVVSSDDGINVSGGNDGSSVNGRPGQNNFSVLENSKLDISGGYISVDALGDGLDSNGSITMANGTVAVTGPTASNNAAIDYNGTFKMSGGFLIAAGSAGMAETPSEQSTQYSIEMFYSKIQQAGTMIHLKDSKGKTIATFAPKREYQSVVISSPELKKNASYTLYSGGTSAGSVSDGLYTDGTYQGGTKIVDFTVSNSVTWLSETGVTSKRSPSPGGSGRRGFGGNRTTQ